MVKITDYSTDFIKINQDNKYILFVEKIGTNVSGNNGNVILITSDNISRTYPFSEFKEPSEVTLDNLVVRIREYLDNV